MVSQLIECTGSVEVTGIKFTVSVEADFGIKPLLLQCIGFFVNVMKGKTTDTTIPLANNI